jgi:hypothetical protein
MCVPRAVMLDRPKNAWKLLALLTFFTLGYLLLIIMIKPFRDHDGHSGWTAGDKAQATAQVAALAQYAMAGLSLSFGGSIDDVPAAVEGTITLVSLVSIIGPVAYMAMLWMGLPDPLALSFGVWVVRVTLMTQQMTRPSRWRSRCTTHELKW